MKKSSCQQITINHMYFEIQSTSQIWELDAVIIATSTN